ncbi:MAG: formylglycine-generating enzyme family protein [Planctomycetota bacterium]
MKQKLTAGWRAAARARDLELELPFDGGPMFFRRIPSGEFVMGSRGYDPEEEPMHRVRILRDSYLGTFPVTQQQLDAYFRSKGEARGYSNGAHTLRPAENIDWWQAMDFCDWLVESSALPEGWSVSLPMELEWEYACRSGTASEYASGDGEAALRELGWFDANSRGMTHPVGELAANEFGLYDMHGNVWEWCLDPWREYKYRELAAVSSHDARLARELADVTDRRRVRMFRGGSFVISAWGCRSAYRGRGRPEVRSGRLGFRVCLLPSPVDEHSSKASEGEGGASGRRDGAELARPSRSAQSDEDFDGQHLPRNPRS